MTKKPTTLQNAKTAPDTENVKEAHAHIPAPASLAPPKVGVKGLGNSGPSFKQSKNPRPSVRIQRQSPRGR